MAGLVIVMVLARVNLHPVIKKYYTLTLIAINLHLTAMCDSTHMMTMSNRKSNLQVSSLFVCLVS